MKSIAVEKLKDKYPDSTVHVEFVADEVPRRADVFVEFAHPRFPFGQGIAVEVQYRNEQKDLTETTASYLTGDTRVDPSPPTHRHHSQRYSYSIPHRQVVTQVQPYVFSNNRSHSHSIRPRRAAIDWNIASIRTAPSYDPSDTASPHTIVTSRNRDRSTPVWLQSGTSV